MPQISSNFILRSKLPNFERDSFATKADMEAIKSDWMDEGHISFCREDGKYYAFRSWGAGGELQGLDRWTELLSLAIPIFNKIEDLLTENAAQTLGLGRIVYVKGEDKFYYNIYEDNLKNQEGVYLEGSTGWFRPLINEGLSKEDIESLIDEKVSNIKIDGGLSQEDVENIVDSKLEQPLADINTNITDVKNLATSASSSAGTAISDLNSYKKEVEETYATKDSLNIYATKSQLLDDVSVLTGRVQAVETNLAASGNDIKDLNEQIENLKIQDSNINANIEELSSKMDKEFQNLIEATEGSFEEIANDINSYKEYVEETYAKPEDISGLLNTYTPNQSNYEKWVSSDLAGDLAGKKGKEIAAEAYSYSAVLDQILFNNFTPKVSQPEVTMKLKDTWMEGAAIDWYDEQNRIILVDAGTIGPDGSDIIADQIVNGMITYPKGLNLDNKYTNGLIPATDEKQSSIGFCKVKNNDGKWDYYRKDGNRYHVPEVLNPGEYRYHFAAFFQKGSPALNNEGLLVSEWVESTPVESNDYVTINASKPFYYNTLDGMVKKPLKLWDDNLMHDVAELLPTCQLEQSFMVPRKLKTLYIWNDLLGDYGAIPMVKEKNEEGLQTENMVPAYFNESVNEEGYYIYKYNSDLYGHRGAIKIKVEF